MSATLALGFLVPLALIILVLLVVVVLVARRDDLDPEGRRPFAAYVFVVVFLTLFTVLFALASMVGSLVHLAVGDDGAREVRQQATTTFGVNGVNGSVSSSGSSDES